jgi:hypothetical protein
MHLLNFLKNPGIAGVCSSASKGDLKGGLVKVTISHQSETYRSASLVVNESPEQARVSGRNASRSTSVSASLLVSQSTPYVKCPLTLVSWMTHC